MVKPQNIISSHPTGSEEPPFLPPSAATSSSQSTAGKVIPRSSYDSCKRIQGSPGYGSGNIIGVSWAPIPGQCKFSRSYQRSLHRLHKRYDWIDCIRPFALACFLVHNSQRIRLIQVTQTTWASRAGSVKAFHSQAWSRLLICIAGLASAMLYGITTLQTYVYYMHYSEDTSVIKFIVAAIWLLDTLHVSFMCHTLYYYLIINYGDPMSLEYVIWSFPVSLMVNVFVITMVQLFFAHKIYHLCRRKMRWMVTVPIILSVLAHLAFGIVTAIVTLVNNQASNVSRVRFYTATPAVSAVVLAEILITMSLCVLLYDSGSRSAVPRTKRLLNTLIIYAVNRCLLTLLVTIAQLVVDANDQSAWTMGLDFIVGKLYANSLLASLNTRQHLRSQGSGPESDAHVNAVHFANLPKLSEDERSSKDRERHLGAREGVVLDIITVPVHDKIPASRRGGEV